MAGVAINRLSLYEETVRRLNQMQSLHAIDLAINASLDLPPWMSCWNTWLFSGCRYRRCFYFNRTSRWNTLPGGLSNNKCKEVSLRLGEGSIKPPWNDALFLFKPGRSAG